MKVGSIVQLTVSAPGASETLAKMERLTEQARRRFGVPAELMAQPKPAGIDEAVTTDEARQIITRLAQLRTENNARRNVTAFINEVDALAARAHRLLGILHYAEVANEAAEAREA